MSNMIEGLVDQIDRVKRIRETYMDLPDGVGIPAAVLMSKDLQKAREALSSMDAVDGLRAYEALKEWKDE